MNHVPSPASDAPNAAIAGGVTTLPQAVLAQAAARGHAVAVLHKRLGIWRRGTWADVAEEMQRLAGALAANGVARGDRVLVLGRYRPRLFTTVLAAQMLGALPVLLDDERPDAIRHAVTEQAPVAVIAAGEHELLELRGALTDDAAWPVVACDEYVGSLGHLIHALDTWARAFPPVPAALCLPDDPAVLFYVTGAAGPADAVEVTHRVLLARAASAARMLALEPEDRALMALPIGWGAAFVLGPVLSALTGLTLAYPENDGTVPDDLRQCGPTFLFGPPLLFRQMRQVAYRRTEGANGVWAQWLDRALAFRGDGGSPGVLRGVIRDQLGLSRVRAAVCYGGALPGSVRAFFARFGVQVREAYAPPASGFLAALEWQPGSGALRILHDLDIAASAEGALSVRDLHGGAWLVTGDAGSVAPDGSVRVTGRVSDAAPGVRAIEAALRGSLFIRDACVVPVSPLLAVALVAPGETALSIWARANGVAASGQAALLADARVQQHLAAEVGRLDPSGAVRHVAFLPIGLEPYSGTVTPEGVLRRADILRRFADVIAGLRAGEGCPVPRDAGGDAAGARALAPRQPAMA